MILIHDINAVLTMDDQRQILREYSVLIDNDQIVWIGEFSSLGKQLEQCHRDYEKVIDGAGHVLLPAFINTHVHTMEHLSRGLIPDDLPTFDWVTEYANPFCASLTEEESYTSARLACLEMISNGTGSFVDVNILGSIGHVDAVTQAVEESGMRAVLGRGVTDLWPEDMPALAPELKSALWHPGTEQALAEIDTLLGQGHSRADGKVKIWASIYGLTFFSSDQLLQGIRRLADHHGVPLAFHIASSREEANLSKKRHGVWPMTRLDNLGVLGPDILLTHCTLVDDDEVQIMAERGVKVAFCPGAALRLAKGTTQVGKIPEMIERGVCVSLGADGTSSSGIFDPLRLANLTAGLFKDARMNPVHVPAETALELITIEGAKAIQAETTLGSVEVGKQADLVLLNTRGPEWAPGHDIPRTMIYSVDGRSVDTVIIGGRVIYENGQSMAIDHYRVMEEARETGERIAHRLGLDPRHRWPSS